MKHLIVKVVILLIVGISLLLPGYAQPRHKPPSDYRYLKDHLVSQRHRLQNVYQRYFHVERRRQAPRQDSLFPIVPTRVAGLLQTRKNFPGFDRNLLSGAMLSMNPPATQSSAISSYVSPDSHAVMDSDPVVTDWIANYASGLVPSDDLGYVVVIDKSHNVYVGGVSGYDIVTIKYDSAGIEQWTARSKVPGSFQNVITAIAVDVSGNVYVTGYIDREGTPCGYLTIKYNSTGSEQWTARYHGPGPYNDWASGLVVDHSGNVYVTGSSFSAEKVSEFATIKYDPTGTELWVERYTDPARSACYACSIALDSLGYVYVSGERDTSTAPDILTVKYDSAGNVQWRAIYDGPSGGSNGGMIVVDRSGGVYVTGVSGDPGTGSSFATVKYNSLGVEQWVNRYHGPGNGWDYPSAITLDDSGNIVVTGSSKGTSATYDFATVKYSSAGVEQWVSRYNGPANSDEWPMGMSTDMKGNVYVTGYSIDAQGSPVYASVKYSSSGMQEWVSLPGGGDDIAVDASGNIYVTGRNYSDTTRWDYATFKYDSSGLQQWRALYNGSEMSDDEPVAMAMDNSGNVYVTGSSVDSRLSKCYTTVKFNSSGAGEWVSRFGAPWINANAAAIVVDLSGNVYVTGTCIDTGQIYYFATVKYSPSGVQQWVARYYGNSPDDNEAVAIALDNSGNVYVTGYGSDPVSGEDYATVKYDPSGTEKWVARYNGPSNNSDYAIAIGVDKSGNVFVTGSSWDDPPGWYFTTVKYDPSGIQQWVARDLGSAAALAIDSTGSVCVTGTVTGASGSDDYATIKYSQSGTRQWLSMYNGPGDPYDRPTAITIDRSGHVVVTGSSLDYNGGTIGSYSTVRYSSSGAQQWAAQYQASGNPFDKPTALAHDRWGNVYVAGNYSNWDLTDEFVILKYSSSGAQRWITRYNGPVASPYVPTAISIDSFRNVFVTGSIYFSAGIEYATIKYRQTGSDTSISLVTATAGPHGSIVPSGTVAVDSGATQQFTITANPGYHVDSVIVDGVKADSTTSYTFTNVTADHTILVIFGIDRFGIAPWTYTNTGINHTIIIDTSVHPTVNGLPLQPGDFIGAFYDSSGTAACAGYEMWTGSGAISVAAFGSELTPPAKNGFATGEVFRWKIYRWEENKVYGASATYFAPDSASHLTSTNTYLTNGISKLRSLIGGIQTDNLTIRKGWSIISNYVTPQSVVLDSLFNPIKSDVIILKNGNGKTYIPSVPVNTIGTWNTSEGYQLKMNAARTLPVTGMGIVPELAPVTLPAGWSIIPYLRQSEMGIDTALGSITSKIIIVKDQDGKAYIPSIPVNGIGTMKPGQGYQVKLSGVDTLVYPMNSLLFPKVMADQQAANPVSTSSHYRIAVKTDNNATVVFPVKTLSTLMNSGDEIGVFDEKGMLVGAGVYEGKNLGIAVWGDDPTTTEKDGMKDGEVFTIRYWNTRGAVEHRVRGVEWTQGSSSYEANGISVAGKLESDKTELPIPDHVTLYQNYPNPFNPSTTIKFSIPTGMNVRVRVYNLLGEMVTEAANGNFDAGYHEIQFTPSGLASGLYFYRLEANGSTDVKTMVFMK